MFTILVYCVFLQVFRLIMALDEMMMRFSLIYISLCHFFSSGSRMLSVKPDIDTNIVISRAPSEEDCSVCVNKETQTCNKKELILSDPHNTSVEFTCPQPQDVYSVMINKDIGMKNLGLMFFDIFISSSLQF